MFFILMIWDISMWKGQLWLKALRASPWMSAAFMPSPYWPSFIYLFFRHVVNAWQMGIFHEHYSDKRIQHMALVPRCVCNLHYEPLWTCQSTARWMYASGQTYLFTQYFYSYKQALDTNNYSWKSYWCAGLLCVQSEPDGSEHLKRHKVDCARH